MTIQPSDSQLELFSENVTFEVPPKDLKITPHPPKVTLDLTEEGMKRMMEERSAARRAKDFAEADRIREELKEQGILLEDGAEGTTWKRG